MATPEEIRKVPRPKNTVIKTVGDHHYVVRRTCVYKDGRRLPVDLETIGKIVNFEFVPMKKKVKQYQVETKDFGNVVFADKIAKGLLDDLRKVYAENDAMKIYNVALLRAVYGDIKNRDIQFKYETSFLSELYKVSLSRQTLSSFLFDLGKAESAMMDFMKNRIENASDMTIVDGMLKNNNSDTVYSQFSRKGKVKGSKDLSLLYALDFKSHEPIAFSLNQGNMLDKTAFDSFLKQFNIGNSVIIGDKGFEMTDETRIEIALHNNLRYLIPIKRNKKIIQTYNLLDMTEHLKERDNCRVLAKKISVDGLTYYAFKDPMKQGYEFSSKIEARAKNDEDISDVIAKSNEFGTIIFESNFDVDLDTAYAMYENRWEIETMFNLYKNIIDQQSSNVHSNYSILGVEFINFLSVIIGIKLKRFIIERDLNKKYSQKQIMSYLQTIRKTRYSNSTEWSFCKMLKYVKKLGEDLDLVL